MEKPLELGNDDHKCWLGWRKKKWAKKHNTFSCCSQSSSSSRRPAAALDCVKRLVIIIGWWTRNILELSMIQLEKYFNEFDNHYLKTLSMRFSMQFKNSSQEIIGFLFVIVIVIISNYATVEKTYFGCKFLLSFFFQLCVKLNKWEVP